MEVHGIDMTREAYRISTEINGIDVPGFVPEGLVMEMLGISRRPGHGEVYAWLEKHFAAVEAALNKRHSGSVPKRPFDRITLAEEA
ncbi:hypothetical protein [uncultured Boseongicola sp.]|jgi:hypothetical protein|uniref:hypothetical protein n=1 Tax=uncultured Boseongicola sp. TaxID=1648499 RepID=UPI00261F63CA|nr:hypothetical protein [uncultured Boseongicola sp.]